MFISEERRIVERIKDYIKSRNPYPIQYIMLRDEQILCIDYYHDMISSRKIKPKDAYVYIDIGRALSKSTFYYPFLVWYFIFLDPYLSKQELYYGRMVVAATGLKYMAITVDYEKYLSIELVNLDTAANNTNLPKILVEVLGKKLISGERELTDEEYKKILGMYKSQKLFAGHNFDEASNIIYNYYDKDNKSLVKEVTRIVIDYDKVFQPYKVCYDIDTWDEIDCWSIKF